MLRDVLVASLFIQFLALVTPLFFQVVVDKALVHKGLTTLGPVYPARVRLNQAWMVVDGRRVLLEPGLAATAEIKIGQRRIIEYLLSPLVRRVSEAGRER